MMMQFKKRAVEAMLEGEMTDHLGYEPSAPSGNGTDTPINGIDSAGIAAITRRHSLGFTCQPRAGLLPRSVLHGHALLCDLQRAPHQKA